MNNNPKNKPDDEQIRRTTERFAEQPKEALDRATGVSADAAETMRDCYAKSLKGIQDYQMRLMEFTQTNVSRSLELVQKLLNVKSPSEFLEVSSDHMRRQGEIFSDQVKQLVELTQSVSIASVDPLKGLERTLKRAA
jgi:phasin